MRSSLLDVWVQQWNKPYTHLCLQAESTRFGLQWGGPEHVHRHNIEMYLHWAEAWPELANSSTVAQKLFAEGKIWTFFVVWLYLKRMEKTSRGRSRQNCNTYIQLPQLLRLCRSRRYLLLRLMEGGVSRSCSVSLDSHTTRCLYLLLASSAAPVMGKRVRTLYKEVQKPTLP